MVKNNTAIKRGDRVICKESMWSGFIGRVLHVDNESNEVRVAFGHIETNFDINTVEKLDGFREVNNV